MKQCKRCYGLFPMDSASCAHCKRTSLKKIERDKRNDITNFDDYRLLKDTIELKGKEFKIEKVIGKGGYATILKVKDKEKKEYALKVSFLFDKFFTENKPSGSEITKKSIKFLKREIERYKNLKSEKILNIYDSGVISLNGENEDIKIEFPYILSELAITDLEEILELESRRDLYIPGTEKKKMIKQIMESALVFKKNKIVHRDISMDNILLVNRNGDIRYIISDLGTSKMKGLEQEETKSTNIMGKSSYLDPMKMEKDNGTRYDERGDIYSLGVIFLEICLGRKWRDMLTSEVDEIEPDLGKNVLPHVKKYIKRKMFRIIKKCVTLNLKRRYKTVENLQANLEKFMKKGGENPEFSDNKGKNELKVRYKFTLPLNEQIGCEEVTYKGINRIYITGLKSCIIRFKNTVITGVKKKDGSVILNASFSKDRIFIDVDKKIYYDLKRDMDGIEDLRGQLNVKIILEYSLIDLR